MKFCIRIGIGFEFSAFLPCSDFFFFFFLRTSSTFLWHVENQIFCTFLSWVFVLVLLSTFTRQAKAFLEMSAPHSDGIELINCFFRFAEWHPLEYYS